MSEKTHSDCEIKRELKINEGMSFVDLITPSDIAFVISIIKNSRHVWDQTMKMTSAAFNANVENEKKLRPLFTEGKGKKKEQGKSLWSAKGIFVCCSRALDTSTFTASQNLNSSKRYLEQENCPHNTSSFLSTDSSNKSLE